MLFSVHGYMIPAVILCLELLAGIFLLNGFWRLHRKRRSDKQNREGRQLCEAVIENGYRQIQMLLRREDEEFVFVSENVKKLFDISPQQLQNDHEMILQIMGAKEGRRFWNLYQGWDRKKVLLFDFIHKDSGCWYRLECQSVLDHQYDYLLLLNISKEQKAILAFEKRLQQLEQESQSKTAFLSRMSHEIRTPMNGITGMLSLMERNMQPDEKIQGYLTKAEDLSGYLLTLINDILDMSRIEAGKIELAENVIDLRQMADQLDDMFRKNIEENQVSYVVEMQDFDVNYVVGDELRIKQVIINFLSNAVKFTAHGEIRLTFRQMYRQGNILDLMIRVRDTGKGMKPEFINHIFKAFIQENADISKKYGGSGLGMAITDQLVQIMGGEIVVDSMPDKGSEFSVYLKLPIATEEEIAARDKTEMALPVETPADTISDISGLHILLAEDNEINAQITIEILEMEGAIVDHAENGRVAVDKFIESKDGFYDVILMDIQMPELSGIEAAKKIRRLLRNDAKSICIIALSADAFVEDQRNSLAAGMNAHLAKPIDFEQLKEMITRMLSEEGK